MKRINLIIILLIVLLAACNTKNEVVVESTAKVETIEEVEKDDDTETAKLFKTENGEYFDFYRLKQVIEKETGNNGTILAWKVDTEIIDYVEYIYETRINGISSIPYIDKCEAVKEFLLKRIYRN